MKVGIADGSSEFGGNQRFDDFNALAMACKRKRIGRVAGSAPKKFRVLAGKFRIGTSRDLARQDRRHDHAVERLKIECRDSSCDEPSHRSETRFLIELANRGLCSSLI